MIHAAMLWTPGEGGRADCGLCAHRCSIAPGSWGVCGVRENRGGTLVTHVFGKAIAVHADPIEKKPLYHFLPGTTSLSIAAAGCNFNCGFCQNWEISQRSAKDGGASGSPLPPERVVALALENNCRSVSYTYTEPTIFFEYAFETARLAFGRGLANVFVTNGFMTAEAIETIRPYLDAANVDLKSFRDETYKSVCRARLQPVLDSIRRLRGDGVWVEVTTLIVPSMNDDESELRDIARFLAEVDRNIPWHLSRFHPDFEFLDRDRTSVAALNRAAELGREAGLNFVYIGNVPGEGDLTICPHCRTVLIRRNGFCVESNRLEGSGRCPECGTAVAGVWNRPTA